MSLFLLKPIHWNPEGYKRPAGAEASSGYPKQTGFGHEEWNNSPKMRISGKGQPRRCFYTYPVAAALEHPEDTLVVMYASHDRIQQLVGIAAGATALTVAASEPYRVRVGVTSLWKDVWKLASARERFSGKEEQFRRHWGKNERYMPNWICPEEYFLWLNKPVTLDPQKITGKQHLQNKFSSYTRVDANQVKMVLDSVPRNQRAPAWHQIRLLLDKSENIESDVASIKKRRDIGKTEKKRLIDARCGQGRFRSDVERRWNYACAATGCRVRQALRASHVLPWCRASDSQRLDSANGLLLVANLDALFDKGLISVEANGSIVVSTKIHSDERKRLGIPKALIRPPDEAELRFLSKHRADFAERHGL